jgi:diacylglycerol kinase (ATP)
VAVAGGDGSLAVVAAEAVRLGLPLAVIPVGTANDFARAMSLPADPEQAIDMALAGTKVVRVDLARIRFQGEERPFLNVASIGMPPAAARRARGLKGRLGAAAYVTGAVVAGVKVPPVACELACDGTLAFSGAAWQLTVGCAGAFGAGAQIEADPADGLLDAMVIPAGPRVGLLRRAVGLRTGRIRSQRGVIARRGAVIHVAAPPGTTWNVDGEIVEAGPAKLDVKSRALALIQG